LGAQEGLCSVELVSFSLVFIKETWQRTGNFLTTQTAQNVEDCV
jgi:hypothetical protein